MGWLIALTALILLLLIPIGVRASYDKSGPVALAYIGPIKVRLYPRPKKEKKKEKSSKSKKKTEKKKKESDKTSEKHEIQSIDTKATIDAFLSLLKIILDYVSEFRSKLVIRKLNLKLVLASNDPCSLALNYGRGWAILGNIMPLLERSFKIKKRNLEVACDFTATDTIIIANVDLMMPVYRIVFIGIRYGWRFAVEFLFKLLKILRKGGKKNEPEST